MRNSFIYCRAKFVILVKQAARPAVKPSFKQDAKRSLKLAAQRMVFIFVLGALPITMLSSKSAFAQESCELVVKNLGKESLMGEVKPITGLDSLGHAMTRGMELNENQADIFEVYRKAFFGDPHYNVEGRNLITVLDVVKKHPELKKEMFPEYIVSGVERVYESPPELLSFIKSQTQSAGRVRANLYQIDANIGFWKKLLDYKEQPMPQGLAKDEAKSFREKEAQKFNKYLSRIINRTNRELLADLKNKDVTYTDKGRALFATLKYIKEHMDKRGRDTQTIRQAMVDLVYTIGYGNAYTQSLLKSENAMNKIEGISKLWLEADNFAEVVGYAGHFKEMLEKLNIEFPTGLSKNQKIDDLVKYYTDLTLQQKYTKKPKDAVRIRSLSLQESAFRSCLGGDCATRSYFELGLDPNSIYFTMTDANNYSSGHASLVLGTATNKTTNQVERVAFLDKLQNLETTSNQIDSFLTAIDLSLKEMGYRLVIPTYLGKDIPDHGGLSNTDKITDYVQDKIMPRLNNVMGEFKPHPNDYQFERKYSRRDQKLEVREFVSSEKALEDSIIERGREGESFKADPNLSKDQILQDTMKLKDSNNPDDILKFISMAKTFVDLGLIKKDVMLKDLEGLAQDASKSMKIRKTAVYELTSIKDDSIFLFNFLDSLSEKDLQQMISEIESFKSSTNAKLKKISQFLQPNNLVASRKLFAAYIKLPNAELNIKYKGRVAFLVAKFKHWEAEAKIIAHKLNIKNEAQYIAEQLNAKDKDGRTPLHYAAGRGRRDEFAWMMKRRGVDLNVKDKDGRTPLHYAAENGWREEFSWMMWERKVDLKLAKKIAKEKGWN